VRQHLIIYAKRPLPGYAKTRLGAGIGAEQAAGVYARLLYTYLTSVICEQLPDTILELAAASDEDCAYFEQAFPEMIVRPQIEGDLGARMDHSFQQAFREGAETVVLTGSDIPELTVAIVRQAFELLRPPDDRDRLPGVIGPATDGGYYLIGMRAPGAGLFDNVTWSTETVLAQTLAKADQALVHLAVLPELSDIDVQDDYEAWLRALRASCPDTGGASTLTLELK
jgi:uncharacterized protein